MNVFEYVKGNPVRYVDPDGLSPLLPDPNKRPPGYNKNWPTKTDSKGTEWTVDPSTGKNYKPYPEDNGHWDHYDWYNPESGESGNYPKACRKLWPDQKVPPYNDQSTTDPWPSNDPSGWFPPIFGPGLFKPPFPVFILPPKGCDYNGNCNSI